MEVAKAVQDAAGVVERTARSPNIGVETSWFSTNRRREGPERSRMSAVLVRVEQLIDAAQVQRIGMRTLIRE